MMYGPRPTKTLKKPFSSWLASFWVMITCILSRALFTLGQRFSGRGRDFRRRLKFEMPRRRFWKNLSILILCRKGLLMLLTILLHITHQNDQGRKSPYSISTSRYPRRNPPVSDPRRGIVCTRIHSNRQHKRLGHDPPVYRS